MQVDAQRTVNRKRRQRCLEAAQVQRFEHGHGLGERESQHGAFEREPARPSHQGLAAEYGKWLRTEVDRFEDRMHAVRAE